MAQSTLPPMVVTASELDDYEWCPQYREWRWAARRQLVGPEPEWAILGKWAHTQLEAMIQGHPPKADLVAPINNAKGRALLLGVFQWWDRFGKEHPWEQVLSAEVTLEADIGVLRSGQVVRLRGIPDAMVVWHGSLWHCSHKTLDGSRPVSAFTAGLACDMHEGLYPLLAKVAWPGLQYGGTMANIIRKLSEKKAIEDAAQALHIEFIPISDERIASAQRDAIAICEDIAGGQLRRRRKSCTGRFGNSLCGYYGPCWQGISIESPFYTASNPLERYEVGTE